MTDRFYTFSTGRNRGFRKGKAALPRALQITKEMTCDVDPTSVAGPVPATAVSPAISLAVSPASSREQPTIETQGSQSSNQSGGNSVPRTPNCYECIHRRELVGDCHSSCAAPRASIAYLMVFAAGKSEFSSPEGVHIRASTHGVRSGWFMWPINFDPVWLQGCSEYVSKNSV